MWLIVASISREEAVRSSYGLALLSQPARTTLFCKRVGVRKGDDPPPPPLCPLSTSPETELFRPPPVSSSLACRISRCSPSSLPSEQQESLFCTPEEEKSLANQTMMNPVSAETTSSGARNTSALSINSYDSEYVDEMLELERYVDAKGEMDGHTGFPSPLPRCLRWSDTIISTEGHPFIASALDGASEEVSKKAFGETSAYEERDEECEQGDVGCSDTARDGRGNAVFFDRVMEMASLRRRGGRQKKTKSFEPRHYYARAVNSAGFKERPKKAELEVKVSGVNPLD